MLRMTAFRSFGTVMILEETTLPHAQRAAAWSEVFRCRPWREFDGGGCGGGPCCETFDQAPVHETCTRRHSAFKKG